MLRDYKKIAKALALYLVFDIFCLNVFDNVFYIMP